MTKTYTQEQAVSIGKAVLASAKSDIGKAALAQWAGETDTREAFEVLAVAIQVANMAKASTAGEKAIRKGALDVWTNTLKRVRKGEKTAGKGEQDLRPMLSFTRDTAVAVMWKTPEPKAPKGGEDGDGEEQGETGGKPGEMTNEQLLLLVQARIEADASFAEQMEEMLAAVLG